MREEFSTDNEEESSVLGVSSDDSVTRLHELASNILHEDPLVFLVHSMHEHFDDIILDEELSNLFLENRHWVKLDAGIEGSACDIEVGCLHSFLGSYLKQLVHSLRLSPNLDLDFTKRKKGDDGVIRCNNVEWPHLFHEVARLLAEVLETKHIGYLEHMFILLPLARYQS